MQLRKPRQWKVFRAIVAAAAALSVAQRPAGASILATATISDQEVTPVTMPPTYQYDLTLNDPGTTEIETFWYSWVPGQDYMPVDPTGILSPTGWSAAAPTHSGSGDGYAIQWTTTTTPLTAGNSLAGFQFDSTATPAQIFGDSPFYPSTLVNTSFVYAGAPLSATSFKFVAPEPASAMLMACGLAGMLARRRR
jgi:hypothetical protein